MHNYTRILARAIWHIFSQMQLPIYVYLGGHNAVVDVSLRKHILRLILRR